MTVLEQIKMEQRVQELEAKVAELEEVVQVMGRLMIAEQPAPTTQVPQNITVRHHVDAIDYVKGLGYTLISTGVYVNPEKTVRAQIVLNDKFDYDVKFSRV